MRTQIVEPFDPRYPEGVRDAPRAAAWCKGVPPTLHVRGRLPDGPAVSIIGSRGATEAALAYTTDLAAELARAGWWVVSGGAKGVDTAAHRGALRAERPTLSVLTGGLDLEGYPPVNIPLFDDILRTGGGLVSIEADGERRWRHQFLQRNIVMTSLTSATIVVHASRDGGAIKAARGAKRLGRPLFFVPEAPWCSTAGGSLDALRAGATPLWCIEDAVSTLAPFAFTAPPDLTDVERMVWTTLSHTPMHVDRLTLMTGLPRAAVLEAVLMLRLDAHVDEGPPGHYRRATCTSR